MKALFGSLLGDAKKEKEKTIVRFTKHSNWY